MCGPCIVLRKIKNFCVPDVRLSPDIHTHAPIPAPDGHFRKPRPTPLSSGIKIFCISIFSAKRALFRGSFFRWIFTYGNTAEIGKREGHHVPEWHRPITRQLACLARTHEHHEYAGPSRSAARVELSTTKISKKPPSQNLPKIDFWGVAKVAKKIRPLPPL